MNIRLNSPNPQIVGYLTEEVITLLNLHTHEQEIYIGRTNIKHIREKHLEFYQIYFQYIPDIIADPDYIGKNPRQKSIDYVKTFDKNVLVAVRASKRGILFVRSMYNISQSKLEKYMSSHNLIRL